MSKQEGIQALAATGSLRCLPTQPACWVTACPAHPTSLLGRRTIVALITREGSPGHENRLLRSNVDVVRMKKPAPRPLDALICSPKLVSLGTRMAETPVLGPQHVSAQFPFPESAYPVFNNRSCIMYITSLILYAIPTINIKPLSQMKTESVTYCRACARPLASFSW